VIAVSIRMAAVFIFGSKVLSTTPGVAVMIKSDFWCNEPVPNTWILCCKEKVIAVKAE